MNKHDFDEKIKNTNSYKKVIYPQNKDDILTISANKRVFIFWQCATGKKVPGYILLCFETFLKYNPEMKIFFLNYGNIFSLIGEVLDWKTFIKLPFALQSDILSVCFLYEYGGAFIDADMIYTNKFDLFSNADAEKLYMFGNHIKRNWVHLAFLLAHKPKNFLLFHVYQMQKERLARIALGEKIEWHFMGNDIFNPLLKENQELLCIVPNDYVSPELNMDYPKKLNISHKEKYQKFWFSNEIDESAEKISSTANYGIIFLHNAYTPYKYCDMSCAEFIKQDITMAKVFQHLLKIDSIDESSLISIPVSTQNSPVSSTLIDDHSKNEQIKVIKNTIPSLLNAERKKELMVKATLSIQNNEEKNLLILNGAYNDYNFTRIQTSEYLEYKTQLYIKEQWIIFPLTHRLVKGKKYTIKINCEYKTSSKICIFLSDANLKTQHFPIIDKNQYQGEIIVNADNYIFLCLSSEGFKDKGDYIRFFTAEMYSDDYEKNHSTGSHLKNRFTEVYVKGMWGIEETRSGIGSKKESPKVKSSVEALQYVIDNYQIESMSDIPCGDFNWMPDFLEKNKNIQYIGYDIVDELVYRNSQIYKDYSFMQLDITKFIPQKTDLLFSKELLRHLKNNDIFHAIANMKNSFSKYLLLFNNFNAKNIELLTDIGGRGRDVDVCTPPFDFPNPLWHNDFCALWLMEDVPDLENLF